METDEDVLFLLFPDRGGVTADGLGGLGSRRARQSKAEQNKSNQEKMGEKQSTFVRGIIKRLVREAL